MGNKVRKTICDGVRDAEVFSILADETKDLSKTEQLSLALRYIDSKGNIQERFLTYAEVSDLTAEALTAYILDTLKQFKLDPLGIVSQAYDGAAVMSGQCSGVQQRVREVVPHALYVHCHAHLLNLVLVDSVKMIPCATEFFSLLQTLYIFVSCTKAHDVFVQQQKVLCKDKQPIQLQRLSDTRWVCRYAAVNAICWTFDAILSTLEIIGDGTDRSKAVEAKGLYNQVATFSFVVSLVIFDKILQCTKNLSDHLQGSDVHLAYAADLVLATKSTLIEYRNEEFWEKVYRYAERIAVHHSIDISHPSTGCRQRRPPKCLESHVFLEPLGSRELLSCSDHYRNKVFYPILDTFIAEISRRFDEKNICIMRAIQACHPLAKNFLVPEALQPLVETYNLDGDSISAEAKLAKRIIEKKKI